MSKATTGRGLWARACTRARYLFLVSLICAGAGYAQEGDDRLGHNWGGEITYAPRGSGVLFDALDPALRKWYVPQELFVDYGYMPYQYTNYSRQTYERYVNTFIEGEPFYDLYGNYLTRGWLIYDWSQSQPVQFGSSIYKDAKFNEWFSALTINSDSQGQYFYSITIGDQIRTSLTPMTFQKPRFNGVQMDVASDKYQGTLLFSRVSLPISGSTPNNDPSETTNSTNLVAGRGVASVGDFVKVGATLVNAHNSRTLVEAFESNPFVGTLGTNQGALPLTGIALVLTDDSPEDGTGGATLFVNDIIITAEDANGIRSERRTRDVTADPAAWPAITGGVQRGGALAADGNEVIVVNYDFNDINYTGPRPTEIIDISFDLVVANDYRIQVWSDRQTGRVNLLPSLPMTGDDIELLQPALLEVARADGNVQDNSNQTRILFDYGLPTSRLVYGFDVEVTDAWGFDVYGEVDVSREYTMYPNQDRLLENESLETHSHDAHAWMLNVSKREYPYFFYGEAFSLDPDYSTTAYVTDTVGDIRYDDSRQYFYEFVTDNDDLDRTPDWFRRDTGATDNINFPGWDENNDFVSDFNQNDNRALSNVTPDYEEPFYRYASDRPEFLFGVDLNNNNWIDRFENDDLPDYPYKIDHRGFNVYGGRFLGPETRLTLGRLQEENIASDRRNHATYGMFTFERDYPRGRIRAFEMVKRVKDNIPDDRFEVTQHLDVRALSIERDILPARDTWITSSYLQVDYQPTEGLNLINKVKLDIYEQQGSAYKSRVQGPILEENTRLFGIINKVDYLYQLGSLSLHPKFKSQFLEQTAFTTREEGRKEWSGTSILLLQHPVLRNSRVEAGAEFQLFRELNLDEDEVLGKKDPLKAGPLQSTGDLQSLVLALQWTNSGPYMGYQLNTQFGLSYQRTWEERIVQGPDGLERENDVSAITTSFITMYAGLQ